MTIQPVVATVPADGFRVPKTAELVATNLRRQIIRGDLKEGDSLPPEHLLTEKYQVSRPTLREAYRILESERLIEVKRGAKGGARVRVPDSGVAARHAGLMLQFGGTELSDVYWARSVMEAPAAALAAKNADEQGLARLRANLDEFADTMSDPHADPSRLPVLSRGFHSIVVEMSGNKTLTLFDSMLGTILDLASKNFVSSLSPARGIKSNTTAYKAHRKLYDLIAAGNVDGADELWRKHLEGVSETMTTTVPGTVIDLLS
jgi:DNA-binding FadR family transcriptional regulator